jgi:hypothetical protein
VLLGGVRGGWGRRWAVREPFLVTGAREHAKRGNEQEAQIFCVWSGGGRGARGGVHVGAKVTGNGYLISPGQIKIDHGIKTKFDF